MAKIWIRVKPILGVRMSRFLDWRGETEGKILAMSNFSRWKFWERTT